MASVNARSWRALHEWARSGVTGERRRLAIGLAFISPWILGFLGFTLYPMLVSLYYSLTSYSVISSPVFVGLSNYISLAHDPVFITSLENTLFIVVFGVPASVVVAFVLAALLNERVKGTTIFRTVFFLPAVTPIVAIAMVWLWVYDPQYGLIDSFLASHGLRVVPWLTSIGLAKPSLIVIQVWSQGTSILIFLAALHAVPIELYDAAKIDGARAFSRFYHVTVPMCTPAVLFVSMTGLIATFQSFTLPYIMTGGGPDNSTLMVSLYLYQQAFQNFQMGYASAIAWILFMIIGAFSVILMALSRRFVYYNY